MTRVLRWREIMGVRTLGACAQRVVHAPKRREAAPRAIGRGAVSPASAVTGAGACGWARAGGRLLRVVRAARWDGVHGRGAGSARGSEEA